MVVHSLILGEICYSPTKEPMSKFLQTEKLFQAEFKRLSQYFSNKARADGIYNNHHYPFYLPMDWADENIFPPIRQSVLAYFVLNRIKWHDGHEFYPSNHLCDSQVCCANFLFPFYDRPTALTALLRPIFPDVYEMLPIEDNQFVACEWIGIENYLPEKMALGRERSHGALFTRADAVVRFRRTDGKIQFVLIEWKYTEAYPSNSVKFTARGTDKSKIYEQLFLADDCPIDKTLLPHYDDLFYEPFYRLMRLQFLANEMEKGKELDADIVSVLHIAPAHNTDFKRNTSPGLQHIAGSATQVWSQLQKSPDRFLSVFSEDLFGRFPVSEYPEMNEWWQYITQRYRWVLKNSEN